MKKLLTYILSSTVWFDRSVAHHSHIYKGKQPNLRIFAQFLFKLFLSYFSITPARLACLCFCLEIEFCVNMTSNDNLHARLKSVPSLLDWVDLFYNTEKRLQNLSSFDFGILFMRSS